MIYKLPKLPYATDALEPYIDALTMEIHHNRHQQAYIDNLNKLLKPYPELQDKPLTELLASFDVLPPKLVIGLQNQGGGTYNHSFFWKILSPHGGKKSHGPLVVALEKKFGSFEKFQEEFSAVAKSVFGSGWAWLCGVEGEGNEIRLLSTPNQNSPISQGLVPLIGLDVWEHAYYLQYQNRRPEYISSWWHVVNWEQAEENYASFLKNK